MNTKPGMPLGANFLNRLISTPGGSIPRTSLWTLSFRSRYGDSSLPLNLITMVNDFQPNSIENNVDTSILQELNALCSEEDGGCIFAQAITLPGDGLQSNAEGTQQGGITRTFVNQGRDDTTKIKVTFLDTTISFAENIIRPWVICTSFLGMVARGRSLDYRRDMLIRRWSFGGDSEGFIYQKWTLHNACPVNVTSEEIEYSPQTGVARRQVEFICQRYSYTSHPDAGDLQRFSPWFKGLSRL